jgi:hypothetical protein
MDTAILIVHGICAMFLVGAVTHQALGVFWPRRPGQSGFVARMRVANSQGYVTAIMVLYVVTFLLGSYIYPIYRVFVRPPLQDLQLTYAIGLFEVKENFAAIVLAMLPSYWYFWRKSPEFPVTRNAITAILFVTVWYNFIAGHILNNVRGFA